MSSDPIAISAQHVSKDYKLGFAEPYKTLRDLLTDTAAAPFRAAAKLRHRDVRAQREARRETLHALDDVSFDVARGEVVGLIGANGAGKSTMLKILSRITEPTKGEVRLTGRVGSLLEVGTGFHPELSGRENVFLNGSILGMRRQEILRNFDAIVDFSGIEKFLDTPVKRYSSGMQVRLAFAVAAHLQPEILLVDEVLSVGDAEFQKKCLGKMGEVTRDGRTVVFVSHNMMAIRALCPRAILLDHGKVTFDGPTDQAYHRYLRSEEEKLAWVTGDLLAGRERSALYSPERILACHAIGLLAPDGVPRTSFRSDEEICVVVEFECLRPVPNILVHLEVADATGNTLLISDSTDDPGLGNSLEAGTYRSTCVIPANYFGDANLSIDVLLSVPLQHRLVYSGLLELDITFGGYNGNHRTALLRPKLDWQTQEVSAAAAVRA